MGLSRHLNIASGIIEVRARDLAPMPIDFKFSRDAEVFGERRQAVRSARQRRGKRLHVNKIAAARWRLNLSSSASASIASLRRRGK